MTTSMPETPRKRYPQQGHKDHDSPEKSGFFKALDNRGTKRKYEVYQDEKVPTATAERWQRERKKKGYKAACRTYKYNSGRRSVLSDKDLNTVVNLPSNLRTQPYPAQITHLQLKGVGKTLQRNLRDRTNKGGRYRQQVVEDIAPASKKRRLEYGKEHEHQPIIGFWDSISYTDEMHIDPTSESIGRITREQGTRYHSENIKQRPKKKGVIFHGSASVSWYHKSPITFYHDEHDHDNVEIQIKKPRAPRKPQRRKNDTDTKFLERIQDWEAQKCKHKLEIRRSGNSMTQAYYIEHVLPPLVNEIHRLRVQTDRYMLLLEDGDPSHGTQGKDVEYTPASRYRQANWITTHHHPSNSPDLNPIEACWNILKERMQHHPYYNKHQYKKLIEKEWDRITMEEIRARIGEMPWRCKKLIETGGARIKSGLW